MALHGDQHPRGAGLRVAADSRYGARAVAVRPFASGQVLAPLAQGVSVRQPSRMSLQVDVDRHLEGPGIGDVRYVNHSCAPTAVVDTSVLALRAVRDLAVGDEVTLFYPATEWEMAEPFTCLCEEDVCLGRICGARALSGSRLSGHRLSPHIRQLISEYRS
ncbi:SET domain-containing protein-lysine N-methyltransferase [Streptomyces blastmyceticus]|uniref:SET domain-containing protein-lysine N-methyltransferase n=1 Tax=Streptomyces blastmyceticus TaxID=68180 RepID=UPI0031D1F8CF